MTYDEQVIWAEIFQGLKFVESNLSFASSSDDNQQYKLMFLDWKVTQNYTQYET